MEWRHLLDDLQCWKDREGEKRMKEGERKERGQGIAFVAKYHRVKVVGLIRARGRLGRFRIATCSAIQPGWYSMEQSSWKVYSSSC